MTNALQRNIFIGLVIVIVSVVVSFYPIPSLIISVLGVLIFWIKSYKRLFLVFVILIPIDSILIIDRISSKYLKLFLILILVCFALWYFYAKEVKIDNRIAFLFTLIFLLLSINTFFSNNPITSLIPNATILVSFSICLVSYYLVDKKNIWFILKLIFLVSIFVSIWGILQYITNFNSIFVANEIKDRWSEFGITGGDTLAEEYHRISATFFSPNTLGTYLNTVIILGICLILYGKMKFKENKIIYFGVIFNLIALFLTFSRTSWFALAITLFILFLIKLRSRIMILLLVLMMPLSLFLYNTPVEYWITKLRIDSGLGLRYYLWLAGWEVFKDNYLFGVGQGLFESTYLDYVYISSAHPFEHPHNMILYFLSEMGLIGTSLILIIFIYLIWLTYDQFKKQTDIKYKAFSIAIFAIIIVNILSGLANKGTIIGWSSVTFLFWILIGIFISITQKKGSYEKNISR